MQRYNVNLKSGTVTNSNMYVIRPIYRQQVVPGQTVNLNVMLSAKTAALTKNIATPALASMWFFYVPHRLVWDDWTSFISKEDGAPAFPTTTNQSSAFFDVAQAGTAFSPLYRRAYKLVYNEYFGTEKIGSSYGAWYDDITDDTITGTGGARNPEQFASRIAMDGTVTDPEFTVTGSTIPLNDFYRQMMNARSEQRSQMTGNKYVDTLARMGVDATWMIAERPEFLGTKSKLVQPHLTANTSSTGTGEEVARFEAKIDCQIKGKHFAEHGYIVGVAAMRPLIFFETRGATDMLPTGTDWIDSFYSSDNLETKDKVFKENNGAITTPDNAWSQRFAYLKNGAWIVGANNSSTWAIIQSNTEFERLVYPPESGLPVTEELGGAGCMFTAETTLTGKTPVPLRVA